MSDSIPPAYGLWSLVVLNSAVFIAFAFSFAKPLTSRDWRSFSAFSAFIVALFAEMYGFPVTIYLLSGWLVHQYPGIDFLTHDAGHLLETLFGWRANPHFGPFHILSFALIGGGFWVLARAWPVLYHAQQADRLAVEGPYARIRHPQYVGFVLILLGFLFQCPSCSRSPCSRSSCSCIGGWHGRRRVRRSSVSARRMSATRCRHPHSFHGTGSVVPDAKEADAPFHAATLRDKRALHSMIGRNPRRSTTRVGFGFFDGD